MSNRSDAVKKWRKNTKDRIVSSMGGMCQICGYKKCHSALALHHIDPSKKEISFSAIRANPKEWLQIVEELRKCILVCHNCHMEIHEGIVDLPQQYSRFDETYVEYKKEKFTEQNECPMCGELKPKLNKYCSKQCSGKSSHRIDWDSVDLPELLKTKSIVSIAEMLGVSDVAVRKRKKKLGLI